MAFWSGEKLRQELPALITGFDPKQIDCATYQLCVGDQAFVTRDFQSSAPTDPLVSVLGSPPNHTIRIAPGQFAFLLTLEEVRVPANAMALISMRARYKFKGLINVSGFHVDPGWRGKLIFSVYNAGPTEVILSKGDPLFLIVYADLDRTTSEIYTGKGLDQKSIKAELLENMTSQVFSPQALQRQLDTVDSKMGRIELSIGIAAGIAAGLAVVTGILVATVALLPSWAGVVIARTLDAANYEIRQKAEMGVVGKEGAGLPPKTTSAPTSLPASAVPKR